jgi:FkbM family methyltransferase
MSPDWNIYAVGAGKDVSFELGLIQRTQCEVHSFDPSEIVEDYVAALGEDRLHFHRMAIWTRDGELQMWRAENPQHVALSAVNLQQTIESVRVRCRSIDSVMRELGHDRLHMVKFAVDGAEYDLVKPDDLRRWGVDVLNIVFLPSRPWRRARQHLDSLLAAGYTLAGYRPPTAAVCLVSERVRSGLARSRQV